MFHVANLNGRSLRPGGAQQEFLPGIASPVNETPSYYCCVGRKAATAADEEIYIYA
jgi:hypothetical protein